MAAAVAGVFIGPIHSHSARAVRRLRDVYQEGVAIAREFEQENADISTNNTPIMPHKKSEESDSDQVRALKKALTESQMQNKALNTLIDVAEGMLKIDIRKKPGAKQSSK